MDSSLAQSRLRLVGADDPAVRDQWLETRRAQSAVARENRQAASNRSLDPTDPRWVLAVQVQSQLEGSALHPDRRAKIMRTAKLLGVRPFDANVIVAIVQDHARRSANLTEAHSLLSLVRAPERRTLSRAGWRWALAALMAAVIVGLTIQWITAAL